MDVEGKLKLYARFVEENIPTNRRLKAHRLYYLLNLRGGTV